MAFFGVIHRIHVATRGTRAARAGATPHPTRKLSRGPTINFVTRDQSDWRYSHNGSPFATMDYANSRRKIRNWGPWRDIWDFLAVCRVLLLRSPGFGIVRKHGSGRGVTGAAELRSAERSSTSWSTNESKLSNENVRKIGEFWIALVQSRCTTATTEWVPSTPLVRARRDTIARIHEMLQLNCWRQVDPERSVAELLLGIGEPDSWSQQRKTCAPPCDHAIKRPTGRTVHLRYDTRTVDYRRDDRKKVGEYRCDVGLIRKVLTPSFRNP